MRGAGWVCMVVAAVVACAEQGPPPGGPVDTTPARVLRNEPDSLATRVAADAPLRFEFSEKIDRKTFSRALQLAPPVELGKPHFDGVMVEVRPAAGWPDSVVIVWSLEPTLKDRHGVPLKQALSGAFTREDAMPQGRIEGSARWAEDPKADPKKTVQLFAVADLFRLPEPGERRRHLWRRAYLGPDRRFRLELLRPGEGPFELEVYLDKNGNSVRDDRELSARVDSLFLPDSLLTLDVGMLVLLDLEGPVDTWLCSAPPQDSVKIIAFAEPAEEGALRSSPVDSSGCSRALALSPGDVYVGLFRDLDGDGFFGPDLEGNSEPFTPVREVEIQPAQPETLSVDPAWEWHPWATMDSVKLAPPRGLWKKDEGES